jgi:membrane protein YdbS with pleckstrin-like domain
VTLQVTRRPSALDAGIDGWQGVSPKLLAVEVVGVLVGALVGLVIGAALLLAEPPLGWVVLALVVVVTVVRLVVASRRIRSIGYVLRQDDLVLRRGILFFRLVAVPYGRMQLVDVNRGPVARVLGLAELRLVTAAAASNVTIPGLPEAVAAELRDRLVERAEERRVGI